MKKYLMSLMAIALVMSLFAAPVFSQETKQEPQAPAPAQSTVAATPAQEAPAVSELSIYGEVQNINAQSSSITVQYYDYDNDEEKSIEITLNKDSRLENVKALEEIKNGDWADVTYVAIGGNNTAKLVSIEKEEPAMEENAPAPIEE